MTMAILNSGPTLGHDYTPDFGAAPTVHSIANGDWYDPSTWDTGVVPTVEDVVKIGHIVSCIDQGTATTSFTKAHTIAVAGELVIEGNVSFTNLLIYELGECEILPGSILSIRDTPIDLTTDPKQWGTGVVIFGKLSANGTPKTHAVKAADHIYTGATAITLSSSPENWLVGDRVLIPDTEQQVSKRNIHTAGRHNEIRTITEVSGNTVQLDSPLEYDHPGMVANKVCTPDYCMVSNLTRDIVIRSQNSLGIRGHLAWTDHGYVDLSYVSIQGMGRTKNDIHNDETVIRDGEPAYQSDNQRGRYPLHAHHAVGPEGGREDSEYQSNILGCVVEGSPGWGITIHGSHYNNIKSTVVYDAVGSGIMEEDGSEVHNHYEDCVIVGIQGIKKGLLGRKRITLPSGEVIISRTSGTNGSGLWFTRQGSTALNLSCYACDGYVLYLSGYGTGAENLLVKLNKGSHSRTKITRQSITSLGHKIEGIYGANCRGFMYYAWSQGTKHVLFDDVTIKDVKVWHTFDNRGCLRAYHDTGLRLVNAYFVNDWEITKQAHRSRTIGVDAGTAYDLNRSMFENVNISGFHIGIVPPTKGNKALPYEGIMVSDGAIDCIWNIDFRSARNDLTGDCLIDNVTMLASFNEEGVPNEDIRMSFDWSKNGKQLEESLLYVNGVRIYFDEQNPDYIIPIYKRKTGQTLIKLDGVYTDVAGMTTYEVFEEYGETIGGSFYPENN